MDSAERIRRGEEYIRVALGRGQERILREKGERLPKERLSKMTPFILGGRNDKGAAP